MALMQSGTGAALSLGIEYMRSTGNVSVGRAIMGGVVRAADYYAKTMLMPKLGVDPINMYINQLGGAVAGGAAYYLSSKMTGVSTSPFDDLLSRAAIAVASDMVLKFALCSSPDLAPGMPSSLSGTPPHSPGALTQIYF